jgi:hypothetical protein
LPFIDEGDITAQEDAAELRVLNLLEAFEDFVGRFVVRHGV